MLVLLNRVSVAGTYCVPGTVKKCFMHRFLLNPLKILVK